MPVARFLFGLISHGQIFQIQSVFLYRVRNRLLLFPHLVLGYSDKLPRSPCCVDLHPLEQRGSSLAISKRLS